MSKLEVLTRRVVGNRRRNDRKRRVLDVTIRDAANHVLFHGKTINVSRTGARMTGLPATVGVTLGQRVCVEFLVLPKDEARLARRVAVTAVIWRIEEMPDEYNLAVKFDREMAV
jgi:hypothetical protein